MATELNYGEKMLADALAIPESEGEQDPKAVRREISTAVAKLDKEDADFLRMVGEDVGWREMATKLGTTQAELLTRFGQAKTRLAVHARTAATT